MSTQTNEDQSSFPSILSKSKLDAPDGSLSPEPSPVKSRSQSTSQLSPREEDFETVKLISNGAYGAVYLVRNKETKEKFAMKKISKQNLMLRNQVGL